jgi:predicted methyltransferase
MLRASILSALVLLGTAPAAVAETAAALAERLAAADRSEADRARDAGRKPAEVLAFVGIEPGMQVLDAIAAGGWYSEVLAAAVGPEGRVYAQNPAFVLKFREGANDKALTARLADGRLPNVVRFDGDLVDLPVPDGSLDAAFTALNFHDVYNREDGEQAAAAFLNGGARKLKPGAVLGIVDHVGIAGQDNEKLHRIEPGRVEAVVAKSPFVLEAVGDVLASPTDDHTENVFAPALRGHTDRFVLRLRKKN